jgi:hypothetical protein
VFPAGHVVKTSFYGLEPSAQIESNSATYVDTTLELAHTTLLSSTDSYLCYEFYCGFARIQNANATQNLDVTMRTVSNATYTATDSITAVTYPFQHFYSSHLTTNIPIFIKNYCGLVSGMGMPASKTTWDAGDELFFRLFIKSGGGYFRVVNSDTILSISITEIAR